MSLEESTVTEWGVVTYRTLSFDAGDWAQIRPYMDILYVEDTCGIVAEMDGKIIGAALFDHFTHSGCRGHMLVKHKAVHFSQCWETGFDYVFNIRQRTVVHATVAENNERSVAACERMGFTRIVDLQDGYKDNEALVIFEMRKENCRYLT